MKEKYPSKWNWNKNSIGKIISNTLYQGYVEYNGIKYQLAEPLIKPQTITKTNKNGIIMQADKLKKGDKITATTKDAVVDLITDMVVKT
jgi:hypothetical protein